MGKCKESLLVYGPSGGGKTTQAGNLAMWLRRQFRDKELSVRLVSCSGGGWSSIQPAIDLGLVEPVFIGDRPYPFETMDRLSKGWWPADCADPGSQLVPPAQQKTWATTGGVMFDSITEISDWMMRNAIGREAKGEIRTSAQALAVRFKDGDTWVGTPALSHYGTIQNAIAQCIAQTKTLSGRYVIWTALELKAVDENTRIPMYGPDIIGKAKTSSAPAWFDNTIHLTFDPSKDPANPARRMYLQTHYEDGIPYVAKNRGHWMHPLPAYLEGKDHNIGRFMELLAESHNLAAAEMAEELHNLKPKVQENKQ